MEKLKWVVLTMVFMLITTVAWGQPEPATYDLAQMVVTAERYPVQEKQSSRFVTVATAEQLIETGGNNLIDALKRVGSLSYKSLAPLGVSRMGMKSEVSIRGMEDGELVLINGVPIQSASGGSYDLNAITVDQVERVEVLSGAASTLYGADAMTGVINIITKQTGTEFSPYGRVEFGEEGYQNHQLGFTSDQLNLGVGYQRLDGIDTIYRKLSSTKGYTYDMEGTNQYSLSLNYHPTEHLYVDYLYSRIETGFIRRYDSPTKSPLFYDQEQDKHFTNLRYETEHFKLKGFYSFDRLVKEQTSPEKPEEKRRTYNYGLSADYRFDAFSFEHTVGGDVIRRVADYDYSYGRHYRDDSALFWQVKREFLECLVFNVGAREQLVDGADGARDYSRFLPSAGVTYRVNSDLNLFANAGKAFRAPSFNDQYYKTDTRVGNPDLNPEEGWTYEAGIKYDHRFISLRVALFLMKFEEKIISYTRPDDMYSYYNAVDYENKGVEWDVTFFPFDGQDNQLKNITLSARGFVANPIADDENGDENQVGPRVQTAFGINYLGEMVTVNCDAINQNDREDDLDSQLTVNLYTKVKLPVGSATFTVDNIFDEEIITGGSTSSRYYGLGRMIKVGYEIQY